jgi:hypothetical protein
MFALRPDTMPTPCCVTAQTKRNLRNVIDVTGFKNRFQNKFWTKKAQRLSWACVVGYTVYNLVKVKKHC